MTLMKRVRKLDFFNKKSVNAIPTGLKYETRSMGEKRDFRSAYFTCTSKNSEVEEVSLFSP
jgi:hypothetical protein